MLSLFLLALVSSTYAAVAPSVPKGQDTFNYDAKAQLIQDLEDQQLIKEVEKLIENLDEDQLTKLQSILDKDLDKETELSMIKDELLELGMEQEDVDDLLDLSTMMVKFLEKIPELDLGDDETSLDDHVKLYLLGLPNRLGPLGFIALHSVLQTDEDIVDVSVEGFTPDESVAPSTASVTPLGDLITRKRRESQAKKPIHVHNASQVPKSGPAAAKPKSFKSSKTAAPAQATYSKTAQQAAPAQATYAGKPDIVSEIIARRKRAMN